MHFDQNFMIVRGITYITLTLILGQYLQHSAGEYALDKPLIIGEFSAACSENNPIDGMFDHLYYNGYQVPFYLLTHAICKIYSLRLQFY